MIDKAVSMISYNIKKNGVKETLLKILKNIKKTGVLINKRKIKIYYWHSDGINNFGDVLNIWLTEKLTNKAIQPVFNFSLTSYYLMIGSILENGNRNAIVWGAGANNNKIKNIKPDNIYAIRGPLTHQKLKDAGYLNINPVYGDPALLCSLFFRPLIEEKYEIGVIPHFKDYEIVKSKLEKCKNIIVIDLTSNVEEIIKKVCSCKKTVSSSLHGIVVSHTYQKPSSWARFYHDIGSDKFKDYLLSVGIKNSNEPEELTVISQTTIQSIPSNKFSLPYQGDIHKVQKQLLKCCPLPVKDRELILGQLEI